LTQWLRTGLGSLYRLCFSLRLTDQSSILKFIEDNWLDGERIQPGGSFDTIAGSIEHMFRF